MVKTTRAQRVALKRLFDRGPILPRLTDVEKAQGVVAVPLTYKQFRRSVCWGDYDCIMVPWCGMWLGIEADGYTHS
jgi:hypothetical protein